MIIEWQYTCKCGFHTRDRATSDRSVTASEILTACRKCNKPILAKVKKEGEPAEAKRDGV
jgi:predicted SprT family Zn-dependent metalloprotease